MASSKSRRDIREGLPTEDRGPVSSNPLEMDAEDFEFYIKEMGYDSTDPVKAKFLRDEWTRANTLGGKAASAYEEATAVPEGRTRMGILPFTKPEDTTGREAILSGQTELAFPGFMTGVGEELSEAVTTGEKMTSGISTTQEELEQAGSTLGELAMVATVPTTAPSGSVRSGLGSKPKGPTQVPTFKSIGKAAEIPDPIFGMKRIKDIFEDENDELSVSDFDTLPFFDESDWDLDLGSYDAEKYGYARNVTAHDLARIKLGQETPENILDYYGTDPTPDAVSYLSERITRLDNDPDFNDYVNKLNTNPDFDPVDSAFQYSLPEGVSSEFRSPLMEAVSDLTYPAKGIEGYQLLSALQKNPSIRKAELDTVLDDIDPQKRYSKEELENIVADNSWTTTARVLDDDSGYSSKFSSYQRQNDLLDPQSAYFEVLIDSSRTNPKKGTFNARSQHFNEETLAHSRASIRNDKVRGDDYLLVEELQTDLLQHGFDDPVKGSKAVSPKEAVQRSEAALEDWDLTSEADRLMLQMIGEDRHYVSYFDADTVDQFINEVGPEQLLAKPGATVEDVKKVTGYYEGDSIDNLLSLYSNYRVGYPGRIQPVNNDAWETFHSIKDFYWDNVSDKIRSIEAKPVSAPPIKKVEESVKLTLNALISEADKRGVDRIVIPPFERIVEKRFEFGSNSYKKALDKSSGFYKTYVKSLNKAIKELEEEFGRENISSRPVDMNYRDSTIDSVSRSIGSSFGFTPDNGWDDYLRNDFYDDYYAFQNMNDYTDQMPSGMTAREVYYIESFIENSTGLRPYQFREYLEGPEKNFEKFLKGRVPDLPVTGTEIDIKGLRQAGYDLSRPRFAKGGLAMNDQMNKLFMARGGLKDDGMNMDPVSGNEIPPGSLAQEVRDDIPAQLSDGEYVVPADVVRYYGVKFFEDLRQEAKTGLSDMETDGRIGGEPAPDMPSEMPAGLGGEMPEGDNMPEGDITPEMFEALMTQAGRGQAPLRMATGGLATLLGTTSTADKTTKGSSGDIAKIQEQRTFPDQTGIPGYSGQTMTTVGGPTIAQIGTGLPTYVYRYIDPLTGKLIDVKPGETPPPGTIPVETAPVEEEEDYDDGNLWENRPEEKPFDPTDTRGMNYNDPVAGAQASYDNAFGSGGVLGAASKAPGIIGFAAGGIQELNRINAISQINGQLALTEARFGKDSAEAAKVKALLDDALEKAKLDNILPQGWYNGTGRVTGAYKDYKKNGGTLSYADWLSGGAAAPTSKPTTTKPVTTKPVATKPVARPDRGESDAGLSVARSMSKEDREKGQEYAATGTARSETWSGGQVAKTQSYTAPTTQEEARQRTEAAVASGQTRATGGRARGGLMRRSNPVKRK